MTWTLIRRRLSNEAVRQAFAQLEKSLEEQKIAYRVATTPAGNAWDHPILIGESQESWLRQSLPELPWAAESYRQSRRGNLRILCGADARGLSYALQDLAEDITLHGEKSLTDFSERQKAPEQRLRSVAKFISHRGDVSWWQSEDYWRFYLKMLAQARFNRLTLVMGFDTAYLSPPYPFFVDVPQYPKVKVAVAFAGQQARYRQALDQIGRLCHDYGLEFALAIWQQIPWQEGQKSVVTGLDETNLADYCSQGLQALLVACPSIDTIHFRVNHESGVGGKDSAEAYWLQQIEALAQVNREQGCDLSLELRAKGMTDRMLRHAQQLGLNVMVSTKYCCEHAALPHHLTQMRSEELRELSNLNLARRYSYADMLRKPRHHPLLYRLWSNGSLNLFTWGDPNYVRRFLDSLALGPSEGFEIMAPLSYQGGHELIRREAFAPFQDPALRSDGYEEARHQLLYHLFGRLGFDPKEKKRAFDLFLQQRFKNASATIKPLIQAYSKLMPFLTGVHFPLHPQLLFWPELSSGGALYARNNHNAAFREQNMTYQKALACDEGLLYGIEEYVLAQKSGRFDGRYTLPQIQVWLAEILSTMAARTREAKAAMPTEATDPQLAGILLDADMLLSLGRYHQEKRVAAWQKSLFDHGLIFDLQASEKALRTARKHWQRLSQLGKAYDDDLLFGVGEQCMRRGHWRDYLSEIDADLQDLGREARRSKISDSSILLSAADSAAPTLWQAEVPAEHEAGKDLKVRLNLEGDPRPADPPCVYWRRANQLDGPFRLKAMRQDLKDWVFCLPAAEIDSCFDLLLYFGAQDENGNGLFHPGLFHPSLLSPYFTVKILTSSAAKETPSA